MLLCERKHNKAVVVATGYAVSHGTRGCSLSSCRRLWPQRRPAVNTEPSATATEYTGTPWKQTSRDTLCITPLHWQGGHMQLDGHTFWKVKQVKSSVYCFEPYLTLSNSVHSPVCTCVARACPREAAASCVALCRTASAPLRPGSQGSRGRRAAPPRQRRQSLLRLRKASYTASCRDWPPARKTSPAKAASMHMLRRCMPVSACSATYISHRFASGVSSALFVCVTGNEQGLVAEGL